MAALGMAICTCVSHTIILNTYVDYEAVLYLKAVFTSVARALSVAISTSNLDGLASHELQRGNVVSGQLGENSLGRGTYTRH